MSLLDDLRGLMLEINGGPGTGRKPMRLGDGAALSRLERALADHEHLEEGARLLAHPLMAIGRDAGDDIDKYRRWVRTEAKRKDETNG